MKKINTISRILYSRISLWLLGSLLLIASVSFDSQAQWVLVGGTSTAPAPGNSNFNRIAVSSTGEPYMIFSNPNLSGKVAVRKYNGIQWVSVGMEGFSVGAVHKTDIALDNNGVPYITFVDGSVSSKARVMKFNGTNWVEVGPIGVTAGGVGDIRLKTYNGNPYIVFQDSVNLNKCTVLRYNGTSWASVGSAGFTTNSVGFVGLSIDGVGNVYVSYSEGSPSGISAMKYNGSSWNALGTAKFAQLFSDLDMSIDVNGVPYVSALISGGGLRTGVFKFDGTTWVSLGSVSPGSATSPSIVCVGTKPVVGYTDFSGYDLVVKEYNGTAWVLVGGANASNSYYSISNVDADPSGNIYIGGRRNPSYNGEVYRYCSSIPTITLTPQTICGPAFTTITPTVSEGIVRWYTSATSAQLTIGSSFTTPTLTSNITYYAQADNYSCTSARVPVTITVKTKPTITSASYSPNPICGTGVATLTGTASAGSISWFATPNGGFSQGTGSPYVTTTLTSSRNYYAEALNNGCKSSPRTVVAITVLPKPSIGSTFPNSRCGTGTVTISATGSSGSILNWYSVPAGGSSLSTVASFTTPSISTTTSFYVEAVNGSCRSNRSSVLATVNPSVVPSVSIVASQTTICTGTNVTFTATSINGGTAPSYQWKLNGANIGGATTANYASSTLANGSLISVVLTSNNPCASTNTVTSSGIAISVTTSVTPSVSISAPQTTICSGTSVTFTAAPTNAGTAPIYQWRLNGSSITGANGISYTSSTLGNNSQISLSMTSNNACASVPTVQSNTLTVTYAASIIPVARISASQTTICTGSNVTFLATSTNGGTSPTYQWRLNGNTIPGATNASYSTTTLVNNSQISVQLKSSDLCASPSTATSNIVTITVGGSVTPSITIISSQSNICQGTTVTFTAIPVNGGTSPVFQWKVNGATVGANSNVFSSANLTNGSSVVCQMVSNNTCATVPTANSNSISMNVSPVLIPSLVISASQTNICTGANVVFNANAVNGGLSPIYRWKLNGNTISGATSSSYSSSTLNNNDNVSAVLVSNETCVTPSTVNSNAITLTSSGNAMPTISIAASQTSICSGATVTFATTVTSGGPSPTYQWKFNGNSAGTNASVFSTNLLADSNIVSCVMTSNATCVTISTVTSNGVLMLLGASVTPSIVISANTNTICSGESAVFNASASNEGTNPIYQWKLNGANIPGANGTTFTTNNLTTGDRITCSVRSSNTCANPVSVTSSFITMTVNQTPSNLVTVNDNVLTAVESGAVYYWGDCIAQAGIPDANNQTYVAPVIGQYVVLVEKNGCRDTSACYTVTNVVITSNDNQNIKESLEVYPNPFYDGIEIKSTGEFTYSISSLFGNSLENGIGKGNKSIGSDFIPGIYILKITQNGKDTFIKVVKN